MKHYGDITKIDGTKVEMVDVITGGSPCQDLSVAGKRAGLAGERSGLFMEQIRIIKEMRNEELEQLRSRGADESVRLRWMVWENVYGAFSSNGGEDFRAVLEETARVKDKDADIPGPPKGGWPHAGVIVGDGWSIAWRGHDACKWGVPQRRKRICLLADFEGDAAARILFESELWRIADDGTPVEAVGDIGAESRSEVQPLGEGVPRDTEPGGETEQDPAGDASRSIGATGAISFQERAGKPGGGKGILIAEERVGTLSTLNNQSVCCLNDQGGGVMGVTEELSGTLRAQEHGHQPVVYGISAYDSNSMKSPNPNSGIYQADTARTLDLNGGSPACNQGGMAVVCIEGNGTRESQKGDGYKESETMYTLNTVEQHAVCIENHPNDSRCKIKEDGIVQTLSSRMGTGGNNVPMVMSDVAACRSAQDGRGGVHSQMMDDPEGNFVLQPYTSTKASYHSRFTNDGIAETLVATDYKDPPTVYGLDRASYNQGANAQFDFGVDEELVGAQTARGLGAVAQNVVRRLTPTECARLQGYPDGWMDIGDWTDSNGKLHKESDTPKYKAAGNSIALPFWEWLAKRIAAEYDRPVRMASLFDGISGFCLAFAKAGGIPIWTSEIEEFPIAVCKRHFGDEATGEKGDLWKYLNP